jgi:hypothetical protein
MRRLPHVPSARALRGALALAALTLVACQPPPGPAAGTSSGAGPGVGSVSFELTIGKTFHFDSVSYDISGNGFHRAATVDVSNSTEFATVVSGIPFGAGYTATLTAQDTGHKLMGCQGSTTFAVSSVAPVPVPVTITCREVLAPPSPSVPVPRGAVFALGALLLALGAASSTRPPPTRRRAAPHTTSPAA